MAARTARAKPARTRIGGAIKDSEINAGEINGMTATTNTIQDFARAIAQMSRQALDRTTQHIEELHKAHSMEEVTSIERVFVNESLEHTLQHIKLIEMLADLPLEVARPYQGDWQQSVNTAVQTTEAAGHAAAASVERLTEVTSNV